ncbi:MAG: 30S ribosomal protein S1, partial [Actinobacteria bacterium]|nr:30S ribosomal protein S1 [Actinomycetota bacterium]NIS29003.1 30S ribosomal protein S1 [Actinomycetota bacterium]NIT94289.1 30S ribosomal protein S1 [Actinomycetota bacterium]NIU17895.1 30S ribosomal protein S1 [Actinomycetota bacterium]NIU64425.1 30S ribosomal protein S1 [Actinomycetota bacterium]
MSDTSTAETESQFGTFDSDGNYVPRQIIDADLGGVDIDEAYTSTMVTVEDGQL